MQQLNLSVKKNTIISFLLKVDSPKAKSRISLIDAKKGSVIAEIKNPVYEDFTLIKWHIDESIEDLVIEIEDESSALNFAYFIYYSVDKVLDNGVSFLLPDNDLFSDVNNHNMCDYYAKDSYRLQYHFSAFQNWINDPNGLSYYNGYYHLFYQFHPHKPAWGNMYWGHAVSKDLIHWKHLPIALFPKLPDKYIGGAFSGSAIEDNGELVLFYTDHFEDPHDSSIFIEHQEMAKSSDGIHFSLCDKNPLIRSENKPPGVSKDFRDPKVFKDEQDGLWKMILGSAFDNTPAVLIYASANLKDWQYEGALYLEEKIPGRCVECPDLFKIGDKYVLVLSIFWENGGKKEYYTRYHIGEYRNNRFYSQFSDIIDFGPAFYALQTFTDCSRRLGIAWMTGWTDDKKSDSQGFAGAMTLPREFDISSDNRLVMKPVGEVKELRQSENPIYLVENKTICDKIVKPAIAGKLLEVQTEIVLEKNALIELKFRVSKENNEHISVIYDNRQQEARVKYKEVDRDKKFKESLELNDNVLKLHLFLDRTSLESFWNDYKLSGSFRMFIDDNNDDFCIIAKGKVKIKNLKFWALKSSW